MTDPVLHEPTIMDTLDCSCEADNAARLQAGALLSLVDAYDRKLEREAFVVLAGAALTLHTQIGKLYMMSSVVHNFHSGVLDSEMMTRAVSGITAMTQQAQTELIGLMKKVVACPTTQDKVH